MSSRIYLFIFLLHYYCYQITKCTERTNVNFESTDLWSQLLIYITTLSTQKKTRASHTILHEIPNSQTHCTYFVNVKMPYIHFFFALHFSMFKKWRTSRFEGAKGVKVSRTQTRRCDQKIFTILTRHGSSPSITIYLHRQ